MEKWQRDIFAQKHRIESITNSNIQKGYYKNAEISQEALEKGIADGEVLSYTSDALNNFGKTLKKAMSEGQFGGEKIETDVVFAKAKTDLEGLIPMTLVGYDGAKSDVWVKKIVIEA